MDGSHVLNPVTQASMVTILHKHNVSNNKAPLHYTLNYCLLSDTTFVTYMLDYLDNRVDRTHIT